MDISFVTQTLTSSTIPSSFLICLTKLYCESRGKFGKSSLSITMPNGLAIPHNRAHLLIFAPIKSSPPSSVLTIPLTKPQPKRSSVPYPRNSEKTLHSSLNSSSTCLILSKFSANISTNDSLVTSLSIFSTIITPSPSFFR